MQIFVRSLSGKRLALDVQATDDVESLRAMIQAKGGVPADLLRLVFGGNVLQDGLTLGDYAIESESTVFVVSSLDGAKKKKRKKKSYTTKKRVPHTRKKEKLKLLKLFKINKDGTIEEQRQQCANCKGAFMAKHKDGRLYCGSCHTMVKK